MASLFDVYGRLLLESSSAKQFVAAAQSTGQQAGDAAGQSMGQRVAAGLKTSLSVGAKALGVGLAGAFGLATRGALELENATARYRAETGATAAEAERAGKTINRVAGEQRASLEAVTDVAVRVKRDLGAVGDQADQLTSDFVRFARVTKQDAAQAVSDFDDIIDNWGLSLSDASGLMDKLLVSQQKFGGSIEDNQKTLAALAPALKAANFQLDDGIALLGLFGAKGLDANQGAAAFAKALTKVKSPQELQALIRDIAATKDPFDRATKAADLFGARAGAKLANALGGANLDDYKISMDEAAGATQKAADVLDSTFSAQIQKKISEVGAALRGLGADFGPLLTGTAALASLGGTLGLDKVLSKVFGKLAGSALVRGAAARSGAIIGGIFTAAMVTGDTVATGLASMLRKLPGAGLLTKATKGLGQFLGSTLGKFASVGFAAVMLVEVFETYDRIKKGLADQNKAITEGVTKQIATGTEAQLQQSKASLEKGLADLNKVWDAGLFTTDTRKRLEADLAAVNGELERRAAGMGPAVASGIDQGAPAVGTAADDMMDDVPGAVKDATAAAAKAAAQTPLEIAAGIRDKRSAIEAAMAQLKSDLENPMTAAKEAAYLSGQLLSTELRKGLNSKDPEVKAQAEGTRDLIIARLQELAAKGHGLGEEANKNLAKGMKDKNFEVRHAAELAKTTTEGVIRSTRTREEGEAAAIRLAGGLKGPTGQSAVEKAVRTIAGIVLTFLRKIIGGATNTTVGGGGHSGPKKLAGGGHLAAYEPAIVGDGGRPELWIPDVPGTVYPRVPMAIRGAASGGGNTYITNNNVEIAGLVKARNPFEVSSTMERFQRTGVFSMPEHEK